MDAHAVGANGDFATIDRRDAAFGDRAQRARRRRRGVDRLVFAGDDDLAFGGVVEIGIELGDELVPTAV